MHTVRSGCAFKNFLMNLTCPPLLRGLLTPFVEKLTFDLTQLVLYFSLFGERREKNNQLLFLFPKPKKHQKKYKLSTDSFNVVVTKTWFFIFWESSCFDKILYPHYILSRIFCFLLLKFKKWRTKKAKLNTIKSLDRLWTFGKASFKYNTSPKKLYGRVQFDCKFSYLF